MVNTLPIGRNQDVNDKPESIEAAFDFSQSPEVVRDEDRRPRSLNGAARDLMPPASQREVVNSRETAERNAELTHLIRVSGDMVCNARTATLADASAFRLPS